MRTQQEHIMKTLSTLILTIVLSTTGIGFAPIAYAQQHGGMGGMNKMNKGGGGWKASLSTEQQSQLAKLKLEFKKKTYPMKTQIKQAKVDLALLITTDKPNQKSIDQKIDKIVDLKSQKMRLKAKHKIAVRKLLNEEQRVKFDMKVLKKAFHGKRKGHHR